jgi:hypothetical protein
MYLEALIVRSWRPELNKFGDALGDRNGVSLEMYLGTLIE